MRIKHERRKFADGALGKSRQRIFPGKLHCRSLPEPLLLTEFIDTILMTLYHDFTSEKQVAWGVVSFSKKFDETERMSFKSKGVRYLYHLNFRYLSIAHHQHIVIPNRLTEKNIVPFTWVMLHERKHVEHSHSTHKTDLWKKLKMI